MKAVLEIVLRTLTSAKTAAARTPLDVKSVGIARMIYSGMQKKHYNARYAVPNVEGWKAGYILEIRKSTCTHSRRETIHLLRKHACIDLDGDFSKVVIYFASC